MMMSEWLGRLRFFLRQNLRPSGHQNEIDDELQFHLEQATAANLAAGMTAEEARRQALIEFGGVERAREQCHAQRPGWWIGTLLQDVRYAMRGFRHNPVFTITVIATLALGIGSTTAVFSVVDRILFRSLPYAKADRIVSVGLVQSLEREEFIVGGFFFDWRDNQRPFEAFASQGAGPHPCDLVETNPVQLNCVVAQAGFLPLLGISPILGRNFLSEEDRPNGPRVALISYGLWLSHYNRSPAILNRQIDLDGLPTRVVGVLPKGFELPTLQTADVIMPMALDEALERKSSPGHPMRTFARLMPGVSIPQARAEMEPLFLHTRNTLIPPQIRKDFHLSIRSLRDRETKDVQLPAWILLGCVLAVMLIACANVASLMVARGQARERELAVRLALGASRGRLIWQTLTEAALLSFAGAAAGMMLAESLLRIFVKLAPTGIPFLSRAGLDLRIGLFTVLLSLVCGAIFGLLPALQRPRALAFAARMVNFRKRALLRQCLVVGQIAISVILLSGAALLLRSFQNMKEQSLGLETRGVLTARIALPGFRYDTGEKKMEFYLQAEEAVRRLPGIRAVAFSDSVPPGGWQDGRRYSELAVDGRPNPPEGTGGTVVNRGVTPDYFHALNIPMIQGRTFTEGDRRSNESLVVISRLLADRLFPGENPIGQRMKTGRNGPWDTIIGVAENVKNGGLTGQDEPEFYVLRHSVAQDWGGRAPVGEEMSGAAPLMIIDAILPPKTVATWVRSQIAQIDPTVPVEFETLNEQVSKMADRPRFETALLGFFAFCGLLMAVIGLYGVISFIAAQRTKEIGVRMALGATQLDILRLISGEGVRLIVVGGVIGLAGAMATAQLLKSLLYGVKPHDPSMYAAATLILALVALAATLIPARAAMKVEPVEALRYE
ncbi:MAG: ABC transporter permease [Terracidiphilus sp.]